MSDGSSHTANLRERLTNGTEDKIGRALADLIENPLITGTIGRAFDARERAAQAQELALSALNIPTAADIERLTRRLRSVSQRLEGIEDGVYRINRALTEGSVERRLAAMEEQLKTLSAKLSGETPKKAAAGKPSTKAATEKPSGKAAPGKPPASSASGRPSVKAVSEKPSASSVPKRPVAKPAAKRSTRTARPKKAV